MRNCIFAFMALCGIALGAAEWTFPEGKDPACRSPPDPALAFPDGFKATVRFSCDLSKIDRRSRFGNLFCRGVDFHDGYCVMVRFDGHLLIDILGVEPQYYIHPMKLESNREYLLKLYVTKSAVRVFIDGKETGSFYHEGTLEFAKKSTPLKIGSMGGYVFFGSLPYLKLEALSEVTLPPGGPKPPLREAPRIQPRAEIKWSKTICKQEGCYIGWPTICRLQNGDLLTVFSGDRDGHICPWGKVQMVRSTDDGETWSAPVTIANTPLDDRDAGIVQMPDGEIIVTWFTSMCWSRYMKGHPDWPRHLSKIPQETIKQWFGNLLIRSRDNGRTWSKPEKLSNYAQTPHGPILLKDGTLLQIGRTTRKVENNAGGSFNKTIVTVSKSKDAGRTWEVLCPEIPDSNGENDVPDMFHEPHAVELADGTLVGLVRYHGNDNCMRATRSEDGGKTWTPMEKTPMIGLPPHLIALPDGKLVNVYGRRLADPGYGEFACISDDGGTTWDVANEIMLHPSFSGDLGYPASCLLPDGDILTVYYQKPTPKEKTALMATRWRVTR